MKRWGRSLLFSLAAVLVTALTLGAGVVLGGSDGRDHGPDGASWALVHDSDGPHDVRVFSWGGGSWLGVSIEEVDQDRARDEGLDRPYGALVKDVEPDSPASRAGIEPGDIIVGFGGERVSGVRSLMRMVRETPEGRTITVDLVRDGSRRSVDAEITAPERSRWKFFGPGGKEGEDLDIEVPDIDIRVPHVMRLSGLRPRLGVGVDSMNPQLSRFLGVDRQGGVFVTEVFEDTAAEKAGMKAGDVIVEVDGRRIEDVGDLRRALSESAGRTIDIVVVRDRSEKTLRASIAEDEDWDESGSSFSPRRQREIERALRSTMHAREMLESRREQLLERNRALQEELRSVPRQTRAVAGRVEI